MYASRSYVSYADDRDDMKLEPNCYCEQWNACVCSVVPIGIHTSVQRVVIHTRVHGSFVYCADGDCEVCFNELPF